jgi:hypothetical protein
MTAPRTMGDAAWWLGSRSLGVVALFGMFVVGLVILGVWACLRAS